MLVLLLNSFIFFFKQKTAYEMRISDWSSDGCSSDLPDDGHGLHPFAAPRRQAAAGRAPEPLLLGDDAQGDRGARAAVPARSGHRLGRAAGDDGREGAPAGHLRRTEGEAEIGRAHV